MRVAVIGAGPAGITAAYQLSKAGAEVEVFEAGGQSAGWPAPSSFGASGSTSDRTGSSPKTRE
ncbi:MAG: Pyridine nucleotide-disulfide oxidoreductase [Gemmataceae bacterium]|nr:Pyridine nucleotide-disulfide oxidoreductase [Gemmataceae bacterium]